MKNFQKLYISHRARSTPPSGIGEIFNRAIMLEDVVHLEVGEPDFDTPQHIKNAGCTAIQEGYTHYTHSRGDLELREAVVEYYRREYEVNISSEDVIISLGGIASLMLSLLAISDVEDEILIPDPGYPPYASLVRIIGAKPVRYPVYEKNGYLPRVEDLEKRIGEKTKAVIINTPNNPTGVSYPMELLVEIAWLVKNYDIFLLSDEVYERFTYDGIKHHTTLELPGMENNLIVINSFSKTYAMTGWRLGFLVSRNEDITQTLDGLQGYTLISPSSMAQRAGIAALLESQEATERMKEEYEERRNLLISLLEDIPDIDFVKPTGAFYLFLNISKYSMDSYSFADGLLRSKKVAVAPGATFGTHGEGHIRLSFTTSKERIKKGVERLKEYLLKMS